MKKSAFPIVLSRNEIMEGGMDLRDWFAAAALTGLLASEEAESRRKLNHEHETHLAAEAYTLADAMMRQRGGK